MKVIIAPDSFKGSLGAAEAAAAIERGLLAVGCDVEAVKAPVADGGEGTVDALVAATSGRYVETEVQDPLGRIITARYGILGDGATGVIEMAAASGLPLLKRQEHDPLKASTYGTGQLMLDAVRKGARRIIVGIGGSATVDGGTGMARGLGVKFFDADGRELAGGGGTLGEISRIDMSGVEPGLAGVDFTVACDVTNPLTGEEGAAAVYGPQKGATAEQVALLDEGLANLAERIRRDVGVEVEDLPGGGAAGGLGAGLVAFCGAKLESGIKIMLETVGLAQLIEGAELVISGEGRVDAQSAYGKVAAGVAALAKGQGVPVILVAGSVGAGAEKMHTLGVSSIIPIAQGPASQEELMENAAVFIERAAEQAFRTFIAGRGGCDGEVRDVTKQA